MRTFKTLLFLFLCSGMLVLTGCKKDDDENATVVPLTILSYGTPKSAVLNQNFVRQFPAKGGRPPYTWTLVSGTLPPGLSLDEVGRVYGTPTATGEYTYKLKLTDSKGATSTSTYTQTISETGTTTFILGTPEIPEYGQSQDVGYEFFAQGGTLPWTFTITGLPDGLTYDPATGVISGTPVSASTTSITITLTDANGNVASGCPMTASFQVNAPSSGGNGGGSGVDGCPSIYDGTYIGQFQYTYYQKGSDGNYSPVTAALQMTIELECMGTANGSTVLQVTKATCNDASFGCQSGCTPTSPTSLAVLPADPPANSSNPSTAGEGVLIIFPNGGMLVTTNYAGALNVSSDGRTLSNSLDPTYQNHTWSATADGFPSYSVPAGGPDTKFTSWVLTWSNTDK